MIRSNPIVIWEAGAIGGTIGAFLSRAGPNVVLVDRAHDHAAKIAERGIEIVTRVADPRSIAGTTPLKTF